MRLYVVLRYTAYPLLLNAFFLLISAGISLFGGDQALFPLLYSALIAILFGLFPLIFVPSYQDISNQEGLLTVVLSWILSCIIGILPYILFGDVFTLTNAWFESVSGYTTTGSSILVDIESLPAGLLFWRASTHWIGGMGIIVFILAIFPSMGMAGMVLYRSEISHHTMNRFQYRTRRAVQILISVYFGLTFIETVVLVICGMPLFDAITHSFATIATGGFSVKNTSIGFYNSPTIEAVICVFMVLSGIHFGLLYAFIRGKLKNIFSSAALKFYLGSLLFGVAITTIQLHGKGFSGWLETFRYAAFQVISIGTSTGFATTNTNLWPAMSQLLLIYFTLQCACAGSTSGGIKVDRLVIFFKALSRRILLIKNPNLVTPVMIEGNRVEPEILEMGLLYIVLYILIVFVSSLILSLLGVDALSSFSGSAAVMGNVGPGLGIVGTTGNFSQIPAMGKWILSLDMLLGRLEIYGLLIFILKRSWK